MVSSDELALFIKDNVRVKLITPVGWTVRVCATITFLQVAHVGHNVDAVRLGQTAQFVQDQGVRVPVGVSTGCPVRALIRYVL